MNKPVNKEDFENYLAEARSWETDKVKTLQKSEKRAWWIASASGVIAFVSVGAVAMLTPLKTVEPYVIRVDNSTGIVDIVRSMKNAETNYEEALNKYFTQWYVRYREGFSKKLAEEYYYNTGIMSNSQEQRKFYDYFNPKNPLSPLNVYGEYATVKIHIKSTSFINPTTALVRYYKEVEHGSDKPQITHWAATIAFGYSGAPMNEKDRAINPLGFQVTEYRNDPDALMPETPSVPAPLNVPVSQTNSGVTVFPNQPIAPTQAPTVPAIQQQ